MEALVENNLPGKPRQLDQERFADLLTRLEKIKPEQRRPSAQTLSERWQFASCHVSRTTYLRTKSVAHTAVSFN
jgi:hypothetical protein